MLLTRFPNIVSREKMLGKIWNDNTLRVNVARVRKKLKELRIKDELYTVRGGGYRLKITWNNDEVWQ